MKIFNSSKSIRIFFFFSMLFAGHVMAQTDYIIKKDGAKTMDEVESYTVSKVKFIPVGEKKAQKYDAEQVNELYKAGHGTFRAILLNNDTRRTFLHVLEDGKIKLYEYMVSGRVQGAPMYNGSGFSGIGGGYSYTKQRWYAQKDGAELVEVKSNGIWGSRKGRKDAFSMLIADNNHVTQRYKNEDKFTFDFVRSLVVEYNKLL